MFRLILQTQARLGGFSVLSHLLSPKVKSTLLSTNDLQCAVKRLIEGKVKSNRMILSNSEKLEDI